MPAWRPAPRCARLCPREPSPSRSALLVAGIATYLFFKIGKDAVGGADAFKPIASLWFATFALAPGFFLPLEQELGRAIGHRRALGQGGRPVAHKVARLGLLLGGLVTLGIIALSPIIATNYFDGDWVMVVALVVAFASYAPAHLARGVCSGSGRFRAYAVVMGSDGLVRIVLCVALAAFGFQSAGYYGMAVAISPLFGVAYIASRGNLRTDPGPEAAWAEVTPNLGWLLIGSVCAAALLNAGPVLTTILAPDGEPWDSLVTAFSYGVLLARIPLFMFQAVQAALAPPPQSTRCATATSSSSAPVCRRLLMLVVAVGVIGSLGALALGPFVLKKVYAADLAGTTLAILAAGSALYMLAISLAQAIIALKGHKLVAAGWVIATVALALGTWLGSDDVFRRVEIGLLVSSVAAVMSFGVMLHLRLRSDARPDDDSVLEAYTDMPFET